MLASLDGTVAGLRAQAGDSLVALDIWQTDSALSVAGFGTTPATGPMLHRITQDLRHAASLAGTGIDDYHVLTVGGGLVAVVRGERLSAGLLLTDDANLAWVVGEVVPAVRASLDAASA